MKSLLPGLVILVFKAVEYSIESRISGCTLEGNEHVEESSETLVPKSISPMWSFSHRTFKHMAAHGRPFVSLSNWMPTAFELASPEYLYEFLFMRLFGSDERTTLPDLTVETYKGKYGSSGVIEKKRANQ